MEKKFPFEVFIGVCITFGIFYLIVGLLEIISLLHIISIIFIPSDFMGGFVNIITATIFLFGVKELSQRNIRGVAYPFFGIILGAGFAGLYLLIMLSDIATRVIIYGEALTNAMIAEELRIEILIFPILLILAVLSRRIISKYS